MLATDFIVEYDETKDIYKIRNNEVPACPDCGLLLSGYDSRKRHVVVDSGAIQWFRLRRLKCRSCNKLHLELPNFMIPNKHYEVSVIEEAISGCSRSCPADDSTIRRWRLK